MTVTIAAVIAVLIVAGIIASTAFGVLAGHALAMRIMYRPPEK